MQVEGHKYLNAFKIRFQYNFRCEDKPTDLPKKATLPSIQTDTMSIAEEEFNADPRFHCIALYCIVFRISSTGCPHKQSKNDRTIDQSVSHFCFETFSFSSRGSISSYTKISRNSSFRFDQGSLVQSPGNQSLGAGQSKKDQSSVIKKLVNNLKQKSEEEMIYLVNFTKTIQPIK